MTTMLVLKRLAAVAVAVMSVLAGGEKALAGIGQPTNWQMGFSNPRPR